MLLTINAHLTYSYQILKYLKIVEPRHLYFFFFFFVIDQIPLFLHFLIKHRKNMNYEYCFSLKFVNLPYRQSCRPFLLYGRLEICIKKF